MNWFLLISYGFGFLFYREIEIESDDETLYQSKRSSQIKRDQHSSLPDLKETLSKSNTTHNTGENSAPIQPSSVSTTALVSHKSPAESNSKSKSINKEKNKNKMLIIFILVIEPPQSAGGNHSSPNLTPKSPRKTVRRLRV